MACDITLLLLELTQMCNVQGLECHRHHALCHLNTQIMA